eukprot:761535-Rhodomonas_salina.2
MHTSQYCNRHEDTRGRTTPETKDDKTAVVIQLVPGVLFLEVDFAVWLTDLVRCSPLPPRENTPLARASRTGCHHHQQQQQHQPQQQQPEVRRRPRCASALTAWGCREYNFLCDG